MRLFFLTLILLLSTQVFGGEVDPTVANLCANIDKIGSLAQIYEPVQQTVVSPVPPYTGIVIGLISKTSVIVDLCNFVNDYQTLEGENKIRRSKDFLNTMTGEKWDRHFKQAETTWEFAQTAYDFENGESRVGYLESPEGSKKLSDFVTSTQDYINGTNTEDANAAAAQAKQDEIRQFSQLIAQKAMIKNATSCPMVEEKANYKKIYEKEIRPYEEIQSLAEDEMVYFKQKLYEIGPRFLEDVGKQAQYQADIDRFQAAGVKLNVTLTKKNLDTVKPGKLGPDGKPKKKTVPTTVEVQTYTPVIFEEFFSNFINKYAPDWTYWIRVTYLTNTTEYGLVGAQAKIENEFRELSYECRERKLMAGYDTSARDYEQQYEKKRKECYANLKINEKNAENLIEYFTNQYKEALYRQQNALGKIWSVQSEQLGVNRFVSDNGKNSAVTSFQSEDIQCSDSLTAAEMKNLQLKQSENSVALREMILKNKVKQNMLRKDKINQDQALSKEIAKRSRYVEEKNRQDSQQLSSSGTLIVPQRGFSSNQK